MAKIWPKSTLSHLHIFASNMVDSPIDIIKLTSRRKACRKCEITHRFVASPGAVSAYTIIARPYITGRTRIKRILTALHEKKIEPPMTDETALKKTAAAAPSSGR